MLAGRCWLFDRRKKQKAVVTVCENGLPILCREGIVSCQLALKMLRAEQPGEYHSGLAPVDDGTRWMMA